MSSQSRIAHVEGSALQPTVAPSGQGRVDWGRFPGNDHVRGGYDKFARHSHDGLDSACEVAGGSWGGLARGRCQTAVLRRDNGTGAVARRGCP